LSRPLLLPEGNRVPLRRNQELSQQADVPVASRASQQCHAQSRQDQQEPNGNYQVYGGDQEKHD